MFTCSACLRRALDSLTHEVASTSSSNQRLRAFPSQTIRRPRLPPGYVHSAHSISQQSRRSHASLSSLRKGHHRQGYNEFLVKKNNAVLGSKRRKSPWALTKKEKRDALAREKNRLMMRKTQDTEDMEDEDAGEDDEDTQPVWGKDGNARTHAKTQEGLVVQEKHMKTFKQPNRNSMARAIREVEQYYKDPLQLANGVTQRLRVPDIDGALQLVRASEHFHIDNVVSWNHCIDYLMGQGDAKQAVKIYNEMKKRGKRPDAHTFTIMLRGYSRNVKQPNAVQEAVKVYNSIFAPNSAVKPSTIHTNAIINVCARGGDMDALWAVAGRLPEHGAGSPDRWTFTTILNAIRENAIRQASKLVDNIKTRSDREEAENFRTTLLEQAVEDGRKLWEDVNFRWRRANLVLDEQLVCAMGRLLLGCGKGRDLEQIFDLVDTTMNLRIPERRGTQHARWLQIGAPNQNSSATNSEAMPDTRDQVAVKSLGNNEIQLPLDASNVYAQPGNNTLSLILDACNLHSATKHWARSYWNLLTSQDQPYKVQPDANNIIAYLRVLRRNRASRETYHLLAQKWPTDVAQSLYKRATFIIAFSTCARDKNNPNVFDTAVKLLRLMEEKLEEKALGMFDESLAVITTRGKEGKIARKRFAKEIANAAEEDADESLRHREGVQSLRVDPKALRYFLELAIATTPGWNEGIRFKDTGEVYPRDPARNNTIVALRMVAPLTVSLKRLVQLKMEEMQVQEIPRAERLHKRDLWDPRTGTRVGERTEELMELIRTMVSAYDRVLTVADRFEAQDLEQLDKKIVKELDNGRRQFAGYMTRIDKDLTKAFRSMTRTDDDAADNDNDEDTDRRETKPQVLQQLESIYTSVDRQISDSRLTQKDSKTIQQKGFLHAQLASSQPQKLKISSRIQAKERENLINRQMNRQFPANDYGVLDEDLEVIEDYDQRKKAEAVERRKGLGSEAANSKRKTNRNVSQTSKELKRDEQPDPETIDALVNNPDFESLSDDQKREKATEIMAEIEENADNLSKNSGHVEAERWYSYANSHQASMDGENAEDEAEQVKKLMERERNRLEFLKDKTKTEDSAILRDQSVQDTWAAEHKRTKEEADTAR